MAGRDLVVVGGSAGALKALMELVGQLPADLPAALLVALHGTPGTASRLPRLLNRSGSMPATPGVDGEPVQPGRIYVAPPDRHLLVVDSRLRLGAGPHEHRFRPAVDPLFRSAARAYGSRVVGVVLSGRLDDGTAGLLAIKRQGGVAVVQDPEDADFAGMPTSAIRHVAVDHVRPVAGIAELLVALTKSPEEVPAMPSEETKDLDWEISVSLSAAQPPLVARPGAGWSPSALSCPDCHGVLWQRRDEDMDRYRCRIGHAWSARSLADQQAGVVDDALWEVLKDVEEQAEFAQQLSQAVSDRGDPDEASYWAKQATRAEQTAAGVRQLLAERSPTEEEPDHNAGATADSTSMG